MCVWARPDALTEPCHTPAHPNRPTTVRVEPELRQAIRRGAGCRAHHRVWTSVFLSPVPWVPRRTAHASGKQRREGVQERSGFQGAAQAGSPSSVQPCSEPQKPPLS